MQRKVTGLWKIGNSSVSIELNKNHRRALGVAFKEVERALDSFERLMEQAEKENETENKNNDLKIDRIQAVYHQITAAKNLLNITRLQLTVSESRRVDPWWAIQVGVARLWEMLEDCKSERMQGYGEVPQASKETLDRQIQQLIDALEEIAQTART